MYDYAVVGGGIVGLATAEALVTWYPHSRVLVLEKEDEVALHQTGRNSGVIHSGIYYKPGSLKARLAVQGNASLRKFCAARGIPHQVCGKLIVATRQQEISLLQQLYQRASENGVPCRRLSPAEVREHEPHVSCVDALRIETTGITDYRAVCHALIGQLRRAGGELRSGTEMLASRYLGYGHRIETTSGSVSARFLIACTGLHSDRVAYRSGIRPQVRIVPFRGEYYELRWEKRHLVNGLIYPVANPAFPFLGVHFTRGIDASVHAGPNAVFSFKREGYGKFSFDFRDTMDSFTYPAFWKLAARYWKEGGAEMLRSLSKTLFVRTLQRLIPEVTSDDLVPAQPGVRAQALGTDGSLVDDFVLQHGNHSLSVLNAPSPAATASLEIAKYIVASVPSPERSIYAVPGPSLA